MFSENSVKTIDVFGSIHNPLKICILNNFQSVSLHDVNGQYQFSWRDISYLQKLDENA